MKKGRKKVRGKSRFIIYWIMIIIFVGYGGHKATVFLRNMDMFKIKTIQVRGNTLVNSDYLWSIGEPLIGANIFDIDKEDISLRFKSISRIKNIKIMRIFPSKLLITVHERTGHFYIKDHTGDFHPLDKDGYVLDKADWYIEEDLPLINIVFNKADIPVGSKIEDNRIEQIFKVYDIICNSKINILSDISEFYFHNQDLHFVDIRSGCRVILSRDDISEQISRFIFLRNNQGFRRNATVDLRFDSKIIVI